MAASDTRDADRAARCCSAQRHRHRAQPRPARSDFDRAKAAGYPDRPDQDHRAVRAGRPDRHHGAHSRDPSRRSARRHGRRREPAGAGGNIGIGIAAHADPDGYTLLVTSSAYVVNPGLYAKIPYDPYKDFAPIAELGTSPNVILVDPKLGVNSIADLVARAKAHPERIELCEPRHRHDAASLRRTASRSQPGVRSHPCAVFRRGPGDPGHPRRHHAGCLRRTAAGASADRIRRAEGARRHRRSTAGSTCPTCRPWSNSATRISSPTRSRAFSRLRRRRLRSSSCWRPESIEILKSPKIAEQLRNDGFEVIANGPDGMQKRIADEVPKWRDIVAKAGIKPV